MRLLKNSVGFLLVLAGFTSTDAAIMGIGNSTPTARPSIISTAGARMPTMAIRLSGGVTTPGVISMTDKECIDAYSDCIKGADACGPEFEECTNKTLFAAKRVQCTSTLMQCAPSGINSLFGTNNQTAFSNKDSNGEFVYPTDGSILGQLIEAGHISNRYDTSNCVRRYTTCLKRDDVCGADFELCTSNEEFKRQKLFCESTLARCQDEGKSELFGSSNTTGNPTGGSRLGIMISEGAALAAVNAVATCYKVADQCILNACSQNPYKCKEGSLHNLVDAAENTFTDNPSAAGVSYANDLGAVNRGDIGAFIKKSCMDTIGANKFCYATFVGDGKMPTNSQLRDEDNKDIIYSEAFASRMNAGMQSKIDDLIEKFNRRATQKCSDTITSCAMRTCGEGSGVACYSSAFNPKNSVQGVTNPSTMADIKYGCEAVVNADTACKYSAATFQSTVGVFDFIDSSLFDVLFTAPDNVDVSKPDPVGAVAALNSKLSTSYSQAALDQMKRQCTSIATGCVRSMCGEDFVNCYRNRTDVFSNITDTGNTTLNKSMNKVGGVLDYTIVVGLCLNTVKSSPVCEEHIKAESARRDIGKSSENSWGSGVGDARAGWIDAGKATQVDVGIVQDQDDNGNSLCIPSTPGCGSAIGVCNTFFKQDGMDCVYDAPSNISARTFTQKQAESSIFRDLVYDLEKEAQAKYNAKLTAQQNACLGSNNGGIMGTKDTGSTFMWVKLAGNGKVPRTYPTAGLTAKQFVASNELYGSFCRIRITLQSTDKNIQDEIARGTDWGMAYFAAGDSFTCGSWIPNSELEKIAKIVAEKKSGTTEDGKLKEGQRWGVAGLSILGAIGGGIGMDQLQKKTGLGGLLNTVPSAKNGSAKSTEMQAAEACQAKIAAATTLINSYRAGNTGVNFELKRYTWTGGGANGTDFICDVYEPASAVPYTVTGAVRIGTGTAVTEVDESGAVENGVVYPITEQLGQASSVAELTTLFTAAITSNSADAKVAGQTIVSVQPESYCGTNGTFIKTARAKLSSGNFLTATFTCPAGSESVVGTVMSGPTSLDAVCASIGGNVVGPSMHGISANGRMSTGASTDKRWRSCKNNGVAVTNCTDGVVGNFEIKKSVSGACFVAAKSSGGIAGLANLITPIATTNTMIPSLPINSTGSKSCTDLGGQFTGNSTVAECSIVGNGLGGGGALQTETECKNLCQVASGPAGFNDFTYTYDFDGYKICKCAYGAGMTGKTNMYLGNGQYKNI